MKPQKDTSSTSWENVASWYDSLIGESGGYYHQHVVFPKTVELLALKPDMKVLDIACGQGAFCRRLLLKKCNVTGVDQSEMLLEYARKYENSTIEYIQDDARTLDKLSGRKFDRIVCLLALQNIDPLDSFFHRVHELLVDGGRFVAVIMHPVLRSPRITGWGIDENRKLQYRRVDRYMTPMSVPITTHPGKEESEVTWAFHRPLSTYAQLSRQAHLYIDTLDEWVSDRESIGKHAPMENLARNEIPLFLALRMKRIDHA